MATSPAEALWDFVTHLGQNTANHLGKRMDKAAGLTPLTYQPPTFNPPPFPAGSAVPGLPTVPTMPPWAPVVAGTSTSSLSTSSAATPDPRDHVEGSYSGQVAQGIACLACTRGHISGVLAAIDEAQEAVKAGDDMRARRKYAMAAAEIDAMIAIDWSPDKLASTPKEDVAVIEAVRDCITEIREQLPTPHGAALALGSAKENVRFAVSPQFTDRDRAEIEARIKIIDREGNGMERGALLDGPGGMDAETASKELRRARHALDDAQRDGSLYSAQTHKNAVAHLEAAAVALTPSPTAQQLAALNELCQSCSDTFYDAYFHAMRDRSDIK